MMADYQPVQESDLESGPEPSAGVVGDGSGDLSKYQPVNDNDLAPSGPVPGQTSEFAYKGIPAAAAKRFSQSNPLANIFGAAASRFTSNFVNTFSDLNDQDMAILRENGYGDYSGPGSLLQHAADAFNSGATLVKNGILAGISSIPAAGGAVEGQIIRETGGTETEAQRGEREGEFATMAALSDVGAQHGMAMEGAAKAASPEAIAKAAADEARQIQTSQANAAAPGIWSHAYRADATPDGDLVQTPLGRLPSADEAKGQAATVADALHLPPETATLIHQTYLDTGRPPAEVLMDAQTNHGGVLDDLVAGKVPTAYQLPGRPMTPEELGAAKAGVSPEGGASAGNAAVPVEGTVESPEPPSAPTPEQGVSKIGQSIEAKAVEDGLTRGFAGTAGYDKIIIADQAEKATNLVNGSLDDARAVIRGEKPLPDGLKGTALITAMEDYIKKNPDPDLAYELANSPLVSATSEAAQEMRLAAERTPDSAAAKLSEIKAAQEKTAPKEIKARRSAIKEGRAAAEGVFLPKEQLSIDKFLDEIAC